MQSTEIEVLIFEQLNHETRLLVYPLNSGTPVAINMMDFPNSKQTWFDTELVDSPGPRAEPEASSCAGASTQEEGTRFPPGRPYRKRLRAEGPEPGRTGHWSEGERIKFVEGKSIYGNNWKAVATHIGTRTAAQVSSHNQKVESSAAGHLALRKLRAAQVAVQSLGKEARAAMKEEEQSEELVSIQIDRALYQKLKSALIVAGRPGDPVLTGRSMTYFACIHTADMFKGKEQENLSASLGSRIQDVPATEEAGQKLAETLELSPKQALPASPSLDSLPLRAFPTFHCFNDMTL